MIEQFVSQSNILTFITVARNSAKLLLYLTYDITDFSQIEAGIISVNKVAFNPAEVIQECTQLLNFNFQRKVLELLSSVGIGVPMTIMSDKVRYMQILLNLIGNALKFTFRGHVKISMEYSSENDLLTTSVEDSGIGNKRRGHS